jgi:hypothetical protein
MIGRIVLCVVLAFVLVAAAAGIGLYAYNTGVAQGMLDSGKITLPATGVAPMPYRAGPFFHPYGWGFGTCLMPLLFFFIVFLMLRAICFPRHMWGRHFRHWEKGYPPMLDEWHRQMHETKPTDSSKT